MTDHSPLERRYRRWLALYPKSFRAEREDEMLSVLIQGADPDQTRPRAREAANLATHGLRRRARGGDPPQDAGGDLRTRHPVKRVPDGDEVE